LAANLAPLGLEKIRDELKNLRTASLELDSLYGPPAPRDPANRNKLRIGTVTSLGGTSPPTQRPPGKGEDNDLPREPRSPDIRHDRAALIGDPRNDQNLIVAQLHLAFLKAHNQLVAQGRTFEQARRLLRQHYQHLVIHDFLKRIADPRSSTASSSTATGSTTPWPSRSFCRWSSPWPPTSSATPWSVTTMTSTSTSAGPPGAAVHLHRPLR
jgi:hypothetical protein